MEATERLGEGHSLVRSDPRSGELRLRTYKLSVVAGPDLGKETTFSGSIVVGSQPEVAFPLTDTAVSRQHVALRARPDGVWVEDLRSTNGTFVGGARIQTALLEEEGTLKVGKSVLRIRFLESQVELPTSERTQLGEAVGTGPTMRRLFAMLERVAPTRSSVVLLGETGTGKDVLARALHAHSDRAQGPFVVFDCGAVASSLVESELFGHVKGAFTGAVTDRKGAFLEADGGTLFLDEIGELPLDLQPKLLRVLEAGTVRRVGEAGYRSVDVRVVAATHRNLEAAVVAGTFRQDLFYRLAVVMLGVPPLRDRPEDIPVLARRFLEAQGQSEHVLAPDVLARMAAYPWPGNIRELRNFIARAVLGTDLGFHGTLPPAGPDAIGSPESSAPIGQPRPGAPGSEPGAVDVGVPFKEAKERLVELFTREYIEALLAKHGGNISRAAKAAGLARSYIHRLVVRHGFRTSDDDEEA